MTKNTLRVVRVFQLKAAFLNALKRAASVFLPPYKKGASRNRRSPHRCRHRVFGKTPHHPPTARHSQSDVLGTRLNECVVLDPLISGSPLSELRADVTNNYQPGPSR
jgi:hypothetical protein